MTLPADADADSGLIVKPFRGIRYAPDRVGDIACVTSPPYDVIGPGVLSSLRASSPYNSVHLILPGPSSPVSAGQVAAERLGEWLGSGVLARDPSPGIYLYEQNGSSFRQRGIIALVRVGPPEASGIHPHEAVMPGPVAGRRALMEATRANLEPIFLVYNGGGAPLPPGTPLFSTKTPDGCAHRLSAVTGPAADELAARLSGGTALIADGHHRYAAYRELSESMHASGHGPGPWDYGLAFLVDADSYPPQLGAIHRVLPGLPAAEATRRAAAGFTVRPLGPVGLDATLAAMAEAGRAGETAFGLAGAGDGYWLLTRPGAVEGDGRRLDAEVLRDVLLAGLWGITDNEREVQVSHDAAEAVQAARSASPTGTAVLCNPVPFDAVRDIAAGGKTVPRKSTSFGPKPRTGLVFRTFDLALERWFPADWLLGHWPDGKRRRRTRHRGPGP